jgi:hypothetical protein
VISYASLIAAPLAFVLAAVAWRWMPARWRMRLSQRPRPTYARFDAHQQLGPEPVVGWPGEFRICPPCGETRYVAVRDTDTVCFERGHVTPNPA